MPHLVRPFSYTQYIRIFVIVNITSFIVSRSALESYYNAQARSLIAQDPDKYIQRVKQSQIKRQRSPTQNIVPPYLQESISSNMAPRKENTKKAAGNAKKAEVAAQKAAAADAAHEREEASKWSQGAKADKKAAEAEKKAQQAAAKAERDRLLAEEEKNQPAKPKSAGAKKAEKKTSVASRGTLSLDQLDDDPSSRKQTTLNASGIDNALDALSLTTDKNGQAVDRHPERRFKAAYKAFEEKRLPEVDVEHPGLRRNQKIELIRKEFEKSEDNPFNQAGNIRYDASKEEISAEKERLRQGVEGRLAER